MYGIKEDPAEQLSPGFSSKKNEIIKMHHGGIVTVRQKQLSKININFKGESSMHPPAITTNASPKDPISITSLPIKSTLTSSAANVLQPKKTL